MTESPPSPGWWQVLPAVVQSAFWLVVGTITTLTYLHAKRTVFQPLKTEVFKLQVKSVASLLRMFVGKDEHDLWIAAGLRAAGVANISLMYDQYMESQLGYKHVNPDKRPYSIKYCPSSMVRPEALKLANDFAYPDNKNENRVKATWSDYRHNNLVVPREVSETMDRIKRFLQDPVLPSRCYGPLNTYIEAISANLEYLRESLEEGSVYLPAEYPNVETMERATGDWILNRWNKKTIQLKPLAEEITKAARDHLGVAEFDKLSKR